MTSGPFPEPSPRSTAAPAASRPVPESLLTSGLEPVWSATRQRLDRFGPQRRGAISCPPLDPASALAIESLLGRTSARRLDLEELESSLVARGIGADLCDALTRLGYPPSAEAAQRRSDRTRAQEARAALHDAVTAWDESWTAEWADGIAGAGLLRDLDGESAARLAADVRRLLDYLDRVRPEGISRTETAAALYGSAHALDAGTRRASAVTHALRHRIGALDERELWEAAGILPDRVSAPALVWWLPVAGSSALDVQIRFALHAGLPLHISLFALRKHPISVDAGTPVLVVENPRLVEAAAERSLPVCVISSNGNPSTAVTTLLRQLQEAKASLWYHGDFDSPGIAICRRMHEFGCSPWMMDAPDYVGAIRQAEESDVQLMSDHKECGPTPWDPKLQAAFDHHRLIIHEEFVLDGVLNRFSRVN
ncbi:TIGR02679 family protein [Candidatus Poriferisocius sp.]|uniref:TIGR02679 family protein n=1 Tax=Candidatus Poriferisocius sp. TaxID=3101276 RepID=UPI003B5C0C87